VEENPLAWADSYVYGVDSIDQHVAWLPAPNATYFVAQDANDNVVALVVPGSVFGQMQYDPYGAFANYEWWTGDGVDTSPMGDNTVYDGGLTAKMPYPFGHQGRWFDQEIEGYHNRAREYFSTLGRFASPDPNGQALVPSSALMMNAATPMALAGFDPAAMYGDGMNPYLAFAANPVTYTDPTGLFVGYQRFVADVTGSAIAAYAFSLDAGIYSLLEEGPEGTGLDRAIESIPYAVAGAFAGGAVAFANRWSPTGNILGGSVAGGLTTVGLGEGFWPGAVSGAFSSAIFEAVFKAVGKWRTGMVVGGAAAGASRDMIRARTRALVGRGYFDDIRRVLPNRISRQLQSKHIPGTTQFKGGNTSIFTHQDPQRLLDEFRGTGRGIRGTPGQPGYVEVVDFGESIGTWKSGSFSALTTRGRIHYRKSVAHIVPDKP
jgi:RHS repeat-associated protein